MKGALAATVLLIAANAAAQPVRDSLHATTGTATIAGTVVSDEPDPHPVRRARVVCSAAGLDQAASAVTDDRGRFTCARLPAGRYSVAVSRDGWIATAYGARRPLRPGTPLPIADGERADVVIKMTRGAVITGTLLDDSGQPAAGAQVWAVRASMQNGERRLAAAGALATADDRGVYRIFDLAPGDYYVQAGQPSPGNGIEDARLTTEADLRHALGPRPPPRRPSVTCRSPRPTIPEPRLPCRPRLFRSAAPKSAATSISRCSSCRPRVSKAR